MRSVLNVNADDFLLFTASMTTTVRCNTRQRVHQHREHLSCQNTLRADVWPLKPSSSHSCNSFGHALFWDQTTGGMVAKQRTQRQEGDRRQPATTNKGAAQSKRTRQFVS